MQLRNLHVERQEALKPMMMLQHRSELKAATRQQVLLEMCLQKVDEIGNFRVLITEDSHVEMILSLDDWKQSTPPTQFSREARLAFIDEMRDWFDPAHLFNATLPPLTVP